MENDSNRIYAYTSCLMAVLAMIISIFSIVATKIKLF